MRKRYHESNCMMRRPYKCDCNNPGYIHRREEQEDLKYWSELMLQEEKIYKNTNQELEKEKQYQQEMSRWK